MGELCDELACLGGGDGSGDRYHDRSVSKTGLDLGDADAFVKCR